MVDLLSQSPVQTALGPSGLLTSKLFRGANYLWNLKYALADDPPSEIIDTLVKSDIAGVVPMLSDTTQALWAKQIDQWFTLSGNPTELRPAVQELYARALLGVRTKAELALYNTQQDTLARRSDLRKDAQTFYAQAKKYAMGYQEGGMPYKDLLKKAKALSSITYGMTNKEKAYFYIEFAKLASEDPDVSLNQVLTDMMMSDEGALTIGGGYVGTGSIIADIQNLPLQPNEKEILIDWILQATKDREGLGEYLMQQNLETINELEGK